MHRYHIFGYGTIHILIVYDKLKKLRCFVKPSTNTEETLDFLLCLEHQCMCDF